MELLTAAQMRAIEQAAIDSGEVTGLELMERAGRGVVEAIFEWRPELAASPGRAVVLCGPGNNGGDGFVVARLLHGQGWEVEVFLYGDEAKLPPDAAENCRRWREVGDIAKFPPLGPKADHANLIIDAILGSGLSRPAEGALAEVLRSYSVKAGDDTASAFVSIDAPSGLCLDSGAVLGADEREWKKPSPRAGLTVTFDSLKVGHVLRDGPDRCGAVVVKPLGVRRWRELRPDGRSIRRADTYLVTNSDTVEDLRRGGSMMPFTPAPVWCKDGLHKFSYGHCLAISGGVGRGGAARLAARGALRIGAGLVSVAAPPSALIENASQLNAIMIARMDGADGLTDVLKDERINAIVIGPGLGTTEATRELVCVALAGDRAVVLDADALSAFAVDPEELLALTRGKKAVFTPHMGEFARLFPDIAETLSKTPTDGPAFSKVDAAREAATRAGCTVLIKGPDTVIGDQYGGASVVSAAYERSCPWLGTAGSGDVLAGFIGGLLARGYPPKSAAETGAWLHQECAREFGPGLIAEDLPETLPKVFRKQGA